MELASVVLEAAIVLMLGALLVFRLGQWSRETKGRGSGSEPYRALDTTVVGSSGELLSLLRRIDERLRELTTKQSFGLPWTDFLDEGADYRKLVHRFFEQRAHQELSMMDELEFQSCAHLASLSLLVKALEYETKNERENRGPVPFRKTQGGD